jgi:protein-disulfide isomerase
MSTHAKRKVLLLVLFIVSTSLLLSGCDKKKSNDWVSEELIRQINELRQDIKGVKSDIAELDKKVSALQGGGRAAKSNAPSKIKFDKSNVLGSAKATVAIVEFTDYQCPFCARHANEVLPNIKKQLVDTGKVQYKVMNAPLSFHDKAKGAAIATLCAGEQGAYWPMHDVLFTKQRELGDALYKSTATDLKLNTAKFDTCLQEANTAKAVDDTTAYANSINVNGTPSFFIGKISGDEVVDVVQLEGARPYNAFSQGVEQLLKK